MLLRCFLKLSARPPPATFVTATTTSAVCGTFLLGCSSGDFPQLGAPASTTTSTPTDTTTYSPMGRGREKGVAAVTFASITLAAPVMKKLRQPVYKTDNRTNCGRRVGVRELPYGCWHRILFVIVAAQKPNRQNEEKDGSARFVGTMTLGTVHCFAVHSSGKQEME